MSLLWALLQDMLLAAVPALGFAMVFNVPLRALRYCALLGAIGHGSRMLMMHVGMNIEWSSLLAAILIGIIGIYWSRWLLAHPKVFTVAAVIPMFSGIPAYKAMLALVLIEKEGYSPERFAVMVDQFVQTGFLLSALVFGLALPGLLFYRQKPVV